MTTQPAAPAPGEGPEAPTGNQPEQAPAPAPTAPTPEAPKQTDQPSGDIWDDPAKARAEIERLRRENGSERVNAKQQAADEARQELAKTIGKALGLVEDDSPPDPADLAKKLTEQTSDHQTLQREHQVLLSAIEAGADHSALLDSRSFLAKVANLDPSAEDFTSKVNDAVKQAVADNPKLKAGRVPGASSVDHPGGSGEGDVTAEQFKSMTGAERNALARTNPTLYNRLAGRS